MMNTEMDKRDTIQSGAALIAAERARQIESEGYTLDHDAEHGWAVLAIAASCYAWPNLSPILDYSTPPIGWPWADSDWKPTPGDPRRQLVKAGALIAAAIDALPEVTR